MNIIRLSATNPHITLWYSASFARLGSCGFDIFIGVVPVGATTGAGAVGTTGAGAIGATTGAGAIGATGAGAVGATGAGAVGATGMVGVTTGVGVVTGTIVVTTGVGVVDTLGVATGVADAVELLEPPPPETTGAGLSTGIVVLVLVVVIVVDFAFRNIFIASILFLRSENTVALTGVSGVTVVALSLRIACTNERDCLLVFADCTIALASVTFCL